jgi:hypothetical protein
MVLQTKLLLKLENPRFDSLIRQSIWAANDDIVIVLKIAWLSLGNVI